MGNTTRQHKKNIRALETKYDGHVFRSRLEARLAVFFRTLGLNYSYEHQGYDLGEGIWYLPDFWIPEWDAWVEVKGAHPTKEEVAKLSRLGQATGKRAYLYYGPIPSPETWRRTWKIVVLKPPGDTPQGLKLPRGSIYQALTAARSARF